MLRSINVGFNSKELLITQRQGVITCIPKNKDKPKHFFKNLIPLTLLDVVYKIASEFDDITIMLTLVKLHSGYYYSQQHELNTNIARLWILL